MALERPPEDLPEPLVKRQLPGVESACADLYAAGLPAVRILRLWCNHRNPIRLALLEPDAGCLADRTDVELLVGMTQRLVGRIRPHFAGRRTERHARRPGRRIRPAAGDAAYRHLIVADPVGRIAVRLGPGLAHRRALRAGHHSPA